MISNACDAITMMKKLEIMGETTLDEDNHFQITVTVNPEKKTISFIDNGIGMTADEVREYINQIAFSGAQKFLEKYKDKTSEDQIIGHFGLGFYSSLWWLTAWQLILCHGSRMHSLCIGNLMAVPSMR